MQPKLLALLVAVVPAACGGAPESGEVPAGDADAGGGAPESTTDATETAGAADRVAPAPGLEGDTTGVPDATLDASAAVDDPAPEAAPAAAEDDPPADWKTYRHAAGTELRHPPDWRVMEGPTGLVLLPPDADVERETILALAGDAGGLTDPMSRATRRQLDQQVAWLFPSLERVGAPRALSAGEVEGAVHDWAGPALDGTEVRARSWVVIVDGVIGGLSLIAEAERFERRAPVVERIFGTLRDWRGDDEPAAGGGGPTADVGGNRDARLVGRFQGETIASGDGVYVNTQLVWAFNADGTVLYGASSAMNASQRDEAGNLEWTATGETGQRMSRGTWSTRDGILELRWQDGTSGRFAYGFEPDGSLVARDPYTRKLLNFYAPMR